MLAKYDPHIAIIEDNTDGFVAGRWRRRRAAWWAQRTSQQEHAAEESPETTIDVVEVYPHVPYIQYLSSGSIVMSIFMMVMIGGGIIFIDDKSRGLHEGTVTPITKLNGPGFTIVVQSSEVLAATVVVTVSSGSRVRR